MQIVHLQKVMHNVTIGKKTPLLTPNVTEDSIFYYNGERIGFYIRSVPERMQKLAEVANAELLSKRVPKSEMRRSSGLRDDGKEVLQFSAIIGSVPPKPHMRRPYPSISSVHTHKSAEMFIKSMYLLCLEGEKLIQEILPEVYERQKKLIEEYVPKEFRFGNLFTSSISNYNISANYHIDKANIPNCVNIIICKRKDSIGGNTTVPDFDATVDSVDGSILVYPAVSNVHGVTPIIPTKQGGYRNTLVFYPLKGFKKTT